jgi:hypothetical protein
MKPKLSEKKEERWKHLEFLTNLSSETDLTGSEQYL